MSLFLGNSDTRDLEKIWSKRIRGFDSGRERIGGE